LKFILQAGNWYDRWSAIASAVPRADELGLWGFVMPDHYMWGQDRGGDSTLETWVALTYLAAKTKSIKLGTLVTPIPLRPPGMLAKELSTLDVLSGGRVVLGVGAGWSRTEFEGYSHWDDNKIRVDKTREGVELILKLWGASKGAVNHEGKYYTALNAVLDPKPIQKPHPPLLFGGVGTRMLKMAGRFGDICCIPPWAERGFEKAKKVVLEAASKSGRLDTVAFAQLSFGSSTSTWGQRRVYDREGLRRTIEDADKGGCEYFIVGFPAEKYLASMNDFVENVMPSFS
jgi:alkanesulfonate monooxygenase SsuD/methylene tetrahydromethanopterin reductase-like flavin-dependent oxidoreductase (luciferase family)